MVTGWSRSRNKNAYSAVVIHVDSLLLSLFIQLFTSDYNLKKINSKLSDYNPNNVFSPTNSSHNDVIFEITSLIVRHGETHNNGHYVIWVRSLLNESWYRISDDNIRNYQTLPKNLNSIVLIFFTEKINLSRVLKNDIK